MLFLLFPLLLLAQGKRPLVWVIDAGHGGRDEGTKSGNIKEKDINLKVSQEVVRLIRKHKPGIRVVTTRNKDVFVSLSERCRIANRARADLFLSIHVNWARKKSLRGTETYYARSSRKNSRSANAGKSELLARLLQNNYAASGRPIYRGVRTNRMYVTANTNMPAALTEIAFISNASDAAYITTEKGMKETARMIFNALMEYYTTTQARTHQKTLSTLRRTNDKRSGVKNSIRVPVKVKGGADPKPIANESDADEKKAKATAAKKSSASSEKKDDKAKAKTEKKASSSKSAAKGKDKLDAQPVFSIQLFSNSKELKPTDKRLKGVSPVTFVKDGKMFKCLYGGTTDYQKIRNQLKTIRKKFPDAFIVAYLGEKNISTAEALNIIKNNK